MDNLQLNHVNFFHQLCVGGNLLLDFLFKLYFLLLEIFPQVLQQDHLLTVVPSASGLYLADHCAAGAHRGVSHTFVLVPLRWLLLFNFHVHSTDRELN